MPSTFLGLTIGSSGLSTYQTAINVTANNIANVETEGYTRQEALQKAAEALRVYTTYGTVGTGVTCTGVEQIRNSYYDTKYWYNNAQYGQYSGKSYYMEQIEAVFYESDTSAGFTNAFDSLFTSIDSLSSNSLDSSYRTTFVNSAQSFSEYFNQIYTSLTKIQEDANSEIATYVSSINSIAQDIYQLTKQINVSELAGGTANELRDQRNLLIDQLSEIVPVDITETAIVSSDGFTTGATTYTVKILGQTLVSADGYNTLNCVARTDKVNQSDAEGLYDIEWSNGLTFNLASSNASGKLKALIDVRDGNNADRFSGTITSVNANGANSTITVSSTTYDNLNQISLNESGTIKLGDKEYSYDGFSVEYNETTGAYDFTLNIVDSEKALNSNYVGSQASVGANIDFYGIPYYMQQLNEFVRSFSEAFNQVMVGGYTDDGSNGCILYTGTNANGESYDFALSGVISDVDTTAGTLTIVSNDDETSTPAKTGTIVIDSQKYTYTSWTYDESTNSYTYTMSDASELSEDMEGVSSDNYSLVYSTSTDNYYQLTANNFQVLKDVLKNTDLLATTTNNENDSDSGDILDQLYELQNDSSKLSFRGGSSSQFLTCILSDIAVDASKVDTFLEGYESICSTIINQRLSESGVDNDEEATNLVKYQNAYDLSCKVIQIMQEIYDKLINETGV